MLLAGCEIVGENPQTVKYVKERIKQISKASKKPFPLILSETAADIERFENALWVFKRSEKDSGGRPYMSNGKEVQPIAGIFIAPFPSLQWKHNENGQLIKIKQCIRGASRQPEFNPEDCLHFFRNKRPGYRVGSPVLFTALEDISLLRKLEESVESLVSSSLFPLFHYKIGTKEAPMKTSLEDGKTEADKVAEVLAYMPTTGCYISDWRHEITAIGSEGKALRIDYYLEYFKNRVFSALGMSGTDFGESATSNKGTATTQSKALTESVEALQQLLKVYIDQYLLIPLLLESSFAFDVLSPENIVEIQFSKIDINEQTLKNNETVNLFQNNLLTHEEARKEIGKRPLKKEAEEALFYNKFPKETAESKAPGSSGSNNTQNQHGIQRRKTSKDEILETLTFDNWRELKSSLFREIIADKIYESEAQDAPSLERIQTELRQAIDQSIQNLKEWENLCESSLDFEAHRNIILMELKSNKRLWE